jgi:outer membrane protein assembly factor BamB
MPASKIIYLGIKGTVLALDASSGKQLWGTHLKGSDFVHVVLDGDHLYASTHGEIFCLDAKTGAGRWQNELPGMGWGLVSIATENAPYALVTLLAEKRRRDEAASSSAATPPATSS